MRRIACYLMQSAAALIARLARAFPRQEIPPSTFEVYLTDLADVPVGILEQAVTILIRTEDWFPTVRAIRAACAELVLGLPSEAEALVQIETRIRWAREPERTRGDAPAVHELVERAMRLVGGWPAFRSSEEPGIVRGQFGRIFRELRAAEIRGAQIAPALGAAPPRNVLDA